MKETGTNHWKSPNTGATNESGFTGLPGGNRYYDGNFNYIGYNVNWWSSSESYTYYAWVRFLDCDDGNAYRVDFAKENGFSVRCLRD